MAISWWELKQECRPIFEREEAERRERIRKFLLALGIPKTKLERKE